MNIVNGQRRTSVYSVCCSAVHLDIDWMAEQRSEEKKIEKQRRITELKNVEFCDSETFFNNFFFHNLGGPVDL
jgi:hypothetical protein